VFQSEACTPFACMFIASLLKGGPIKKWTFLQFFPPFVFNYEVQILHFGDFLVSAG